jgi:hypothetical protein
MSITGIYVAFTEALVSLAGGSHGLAHVHAGLLIYVTSQVLSRNRRASEQGLVAVLGFELANEIIEAAYYGSFRWVDTVGDIFVTLAWPVILFSLAKYRRRRWARAEAALRDRGLATLHTHPPTEAKPAQTVPRA